MDVKWDAKYKDYKTEKQWLDDGYLLLDGHPGVELRYLKGWTIHTLYFGPDDVRKAEIKELRRKRCEYKYRGCDDEEIQR